MDSFIQEVFRANWEGYRKAHRLPLRAHKAGSAWSSCRTAERGGHVRRCAAGHVQGVWYNSCRHRACPLCAWRDRERWVNAQIERLPGCDYFHVVFTVPDELNGLWSYNRERFTKLLLRAGWETLRQMLGDPKHLGALPGALAGFHSWGQTLWVHPHAHFLVTAGGLDDQGVWRPCRYQGLLPARAVSAKFRGKLRAWLIRDLQRGALRAPPDRPAHRWEHELNRLGRKRWHVHIQPRYRHGRGVVRYLGRYLKGGCVSDRRLSRGADGQVELSYKDNRCHPPKRMRLRLSEEELMGRVLAHVPETGQHVVRSYGLFASSKRGELAEVRQRCGGLPGPESGPGSGEQPRPEGPDVIRLPEPERCPVCGRPLLVYVLPRRSRAPP